MREVIEETTLQLWAEGYREVNIYTLVCTVSKTLIKNDRQKWRLFYSSSLFLISATFAVAFISFFYLCMTCEWFLNYLNGKSFTNITGKNYIFIVSPSTRFSIKFEFSQQKKTNWLSHTPQRLSCCLFMTTLLSDIYKKWHAHTNQITYRISNLLCHSEYQWCGCE